MLVHSENISIFSYKSYIFVISSALLIDVIDSSSFIIYDASYISLFPYKHCIDQINFSSVSLLGSFLSYSYDIKKPSGVFSSVSSIMSSTISYMSLHSEFSLFDSSSSFSVVSSIIVIPVSHSNIVY